MLNALLVGERRKRITPELTQTFLDDLNRLPVEACGALLKPETSASYKITYTTS
jgi:hypothetical protein